VTQPSRLIPLARHEIRAEDLEAVSAALRSGRLALGPWTRQLEERLADYVGVRHAVAVNSGTSALHLIIRALGIGPADEVITTPFSFVASTNAILFERATPVLADIDPESLCIDPEQVERAITPRTKAILAVDVFGRPADWPALEEIAQAHDLALIEDSAEALGSELDGRRCGSFGRAGIFGFYPNKQITTGEGGAVVTDDDSLASLCRSMANQGRGDESTWLQHVRLGFNYRLDEMSGALGCSQLGRIDRFIEARAQIVAWYADRLADVGELAVPTAAFPGRMSWFVYVVHLSDRHTREDRDAILQGLNARGIGCSDYFQPIHLQPFVREALGTKEGDYPVTEAVGARTLALPFFVGLTQDDVGFVAECLAELMQSRGQDG